MLTRLSAPNGLAIPLEELKQHLLVNFDDDDDRLENLTRSETRRYEDFTGRIMLPTDFEAGFASWCEPLLIDAAPIRVVTEVVYLDESNVEQALDAGDWYSTTTESGAEIRFTDTFDSPGLSDRPYPVTVRFSAGYDEDGASGSGDDPELDPVENDQRNIMLMVMTIYEWNEAITDETMRHRFGNRRIFR